MKVDRRTQRILRGRDPGDVIDVGMREQDVPDVELVCLDRGQQLIDLVAGIDQHAGPGALAPHHESVLEERRHRPDIQNHANPTFVLD